MLLQSLVDYNLNDDEALQGFLGCYHNCGHSTQRLSVTAIFISLQWFLLFTERELKSLCIYNDGNYY